MPFSVPDFLFKLDSLSGISSGSTHLILAADHLKFLRGDLLVLKTRDELFRNPVIFYRRGVGEHMGVILLE